MAESYLSVLIHEPFLLKGILLPSVETAPRGKDPLPSGATKTGNNLPNPILTNHSLYIFFASLPNPKNKNTKKPQARFAHLSYKTVDGITIDEFQVAGLWSLEKLKGRFWCGYWVTMM